MSITLNAVATSKPEFRAWRWVLVLCLALLTAALNEAWAGGIEKLSRLKAVAEDAVQQAGRKHGERISAEARLDPRLALAACGQAPETRLQNRLNGSSTTVTLKCLGPEPWTLYVPVNMKRRAAVAVLQRPLARGAALSMSDVKFEQRELGGLSYGYYTVRSLRDGLMARRNLSAGATLTPSDLVAETLIRRGQAVTLVGRIGNIEVRARGTALAAGSRNARIKVRNMNSKRIIEGRVRSASEVDVVM